ncbi:MAG: Lrp/AsnC family transcriptional regulator [Candidatus Odinarchaeia archaeon]
MKIDKLDKYILKMLQEDSRTAFTKIADEVTMKLVEEKELKKGEKIPDTTIHFRVKKMKDNNIIKRFTVDISPKLLGYEIFGIVKLVIGGHIIKKISLKRAQKLANDLAKNPLITFIGLAEDGTTIHLLVLAHNKEEFMNLIEEIGRNPDVDSLDYFILSEIKKGEEIVKPSPI